jgi:hypothetical protein
MEGFFVRVVINKSGMAQDLIKELETKVAENTISV